MTARSTARWITAVAMLDLAASSASSQALGSSPPTYAPGHRWLVNGTAYTLERIERDTYVYVAGADELHLSRSLGLGRVVHGGVTVWESDPPLDLAWPIEPGHWQTRVTSMRRVGSPIVIFSADSTVTRTAWAVDGRDQVPSEQGPLDAWRIVVTFEIGNGAHAYPMGGLWIWYAPARDAIVKMQSYGRLGPPLPPARVESFAPAG